MSTDARSFGHGARAEILARIRRATGVGSGAEAIGAEWQCIERAYRQDDGTCSRAGLLDLLEDRLRDYDAGVYRTRESGMRELIGTILGERGKSRMAVPAGLPRRWLPESVSFLEDTREGIAAIDGCDGVLTTATLAIAETGSIVLQDSFGRDWLDADVHGQGRRALTLLPDYHLCVVEEGTVVYSVPQAIARLQPAAALATTFFSGPSATADIEMTRIKGVHGPRFVDVILILSA